MTKIGAGLLMYRIQDGSPEILLAHPGGPFFKNKDEGFWSIPKGLADNGETGDQLLDVAKREFEEETGTKPESSDFVSLGAVERPGKTVAIWAFEGDMDVTKATSNTCFVEWPPRSGKQLEISEVDRVAFFELAEARTKLERYQVSAIDAFEAYLASL